MKNIQISDNDLEFLRDLQHELKTQSTDGNAEPVFWGIIEEKTSIVPENFGSDTVFVLSDNEGEQKTLEEVVDYINEYLESEDLSDVEITKGAWDEVDKTYIPDVLDFIQNFIDPCAVTYELSKHDELSTYTGAFITKRAAKTYIEKYGYNHSNPRTYAMTAIRNPEFEHLINIIKNLEL